MKARSVLALCASLLGADSAYGSLQLLQVMPEVVHAEPDPRGWRLNFDVLLENTGRTPVVINYLELEAFDSEGRLITRVHLGGGGLPPAIDSLPQRVVPAEGRLHLFNPFETLPADLAFETLRFGIHHSAGRLSVPIRPSMDVPYVLPVLPLGGASFVESGADLRSPHRRASVTDPRRRVFGRRRVSERYAVDLTRIDEQGAYRDGPRETPASWFAWDEPVRSPARGTVISARSDIPDNALLPGGGMTPPDPALDDAGYLLGNHVVVELPGGVHLVVAHLREGSIDVEVGDAVWEGALLGRIGLSGRTTYPHLRMQLQRGQNVLDADPLPLVFACVRDAGGDVRRPGWLATGDRVQACGIGQEGRRLRERR
ncbi:MAG: M23 family metallopeptidase [Pseudomonadota bacterium]|nr:M23 family metallopeptidase [Pseudomonadota bacterium]